MKVKINIDEKIDEIFIEIYKNEKICTKCIQQREDIFIKY